MNIAKSKKPIKFIDNTRRNINTMQHRIIISAKRNKLMKNISTILDRLMKEQDISSSAALARMTGVSQPVIYRLLSGETSNPQVDTLKPIANYFKISIDQLLGLTPLKQNTVLNNQSIHELNTKLSTIKTISSVLVDFLPGLIEGYQKALEANLIKETVSSDILPLLVLNSSNLLKLSDQINQLLINNLTSQD